MNRIVCLLFGASALLVSTSSLADVAPDPCDGLNAGDACTMPNNKPGTCVDQGGFVACVENGGSTTSTGGSTTSTGGSTTGGGDDGGSSDDGCSATASTKSALPGFALVGLALGAFAAAGRKRRARK
ncbi:MAG: hypothetical protein JNL21_28560 [Myxococcales bacterium]|nr:hypothetical protein [Myxococcales bacterium]